ncbi:MAG: hypothetical protein KDK76_03780 [Chlamydiia bacterium]|nr:hypothetical protein [Chlamydiia bacterium]
MNLSVQNQPQHLPTFTIHVDNHSETRLDLVVCQLGNQVFRVPYPGGRSFTITFQEPAAGDNPHLKLTGFQHDSLLGVVIRVTSRTYPPTKYREDFIIFS